MSLFNHYYQHRDNSDNRDNFGHYNRDKKFTYHYIPSVCECVCVCFSLLIFSLTPSLLSNIYCIVVELLRLNYIFAVLQSHQFIGVCVCVCVCVRACVRACVRGVCVSERVGFALLMF